MNATPVRRYLVSYCVLTSLIVWAIGPARLTGHHTPVLSRDWKEIGSGYVCPVTGYKYGSN